MKRLIVNADDFGLHAAINRGIIDGHASGCITSTSVMTGGEAFADAAARAAAHPELGVGVHLTLVGAKPVADPGRIPSLVDREGWFMPQYPQFLARYLRGGIRLEEIRQEFEAQIHKALAAGMTIGHLDSHQHLHVLPGVIDIVLDIASRLGIKALRIPAERATFLGGYPFALARTISRSGLAALAGLARRKARRRGFAVPDHFFGMLAGGNLREEYLINIIDHLPEGTSEIMIHPGDDDDALGAQFGWGYHWHSELAAAKSAEVRRRITAGNIKLVTFGELRNG